MKAKIERNKALVKLRDKGWTWRGLAAEFGFRSHNTAKQIYHTFKPKFSRAVDKSAQKPIDNPHKVV